MVLTLVDWSGKSHNVNHDLNFQTAKYEVKHVINFRNPKAGTPLFDKLRSSGPMPGENVNGDKKRQSEVGAAAPKKKKGGDGKGVDMDLLADGLQKLEEDDLLQVVQMVHDNKSEDSWMRNDVERTSLLALIHAAVNKSGLTANQSLQKVNSTSTSTHFPTP